MTPHGSVQTLTTGAILPAMEPCAVMLTTGTDRVPFNGAKNQQRQDEKQLSGAVDTIRALPDNVILIAYISR